VERFAHREFQHVTGGRGQDGCWGIQENPSPSKR
jgi:hypothetical protein